MKLVTLPGARVSPTLALQRTLQKADRIKAVTIVIQWDDDTYDVDWSNMKTSELCCAATRLNVAAQDTFMGRDPDNIYHPPNSGSDGDSA